jgi:hypothetical protein
MTALNPEEMMRKWQSRTVQVLRAQERISQGMMAAARAELRFGQEFMASRLSMLHWDTTEPGHVSEQAQRDIENLVGVMREVAEEIRTGFAEAAEMMRGEIQAAVREEAVKASEVASKMAYAAQAAADDAMAKTGEAAALAEEEMDKTAEAGRRAARRSKGEAG